MSEAEQISHFASDLDALIRRYIAEYNLTLGSAIGTLEIAQLKLFTEQTRTEEDEDP